MFVRGPQYPSAFQGVSTDIGDPEALLAYENGDRKSLKGSTLTLMGATVNKPYPNVPPRYVVNTYVLNSFVKLQRSYFFLFFFNNLLFVVLL